MKFSRFMSLNDKIGAGIPRSQSWVNLRRQGKLTLQIVTIGAVLIAGEGVLFAQAATSTNSSTQKPVKPGAVQADTIVVQDSAITSQEVAEHELANVAGGTSLIDTAKLEQGRIANVADALKFQPGVLAQSQNGGEATRLSIRGSGITRGAQLFGWGTQVLIDGLPQLSTSGFPYEHIDPAVTSRIEILRGGNGFEYGPTSLGGAVNYVTHTGYDSSPFQLRVEAGSYGYYKQVASSGLVSGPADYYLAVDHMDLNGYRDSSQSTSSRVVSNFGYKISEDVETRFNFRYTQQYQNDAGTLTWKQLQANPTQENPAYGGTTRVRANPGSYLTSNKTTVQIDPDSKLESGFQYNNVPIDGYGGGSQTNFDFDDFSGSMRYTRDDLLFGDRQSKTLIAFYAWTQLNATFDNFDVNWNPTGRRPSEMSDWSWVAKNDLEVVDKFWLETGVDVTWQTRWTQIEYSSAATAPQGKEISEEYLNILPRLGVRYEITENQQVFANVTRSVDAPSSNSLIRTQANGAPLGVVQLNEQTATTVEVGTRGKESIFQWDLSLYHSWVSNELLLTNLTPGAANATNLTTNGTATHHQGVELGLDTTLWESKDIPKDKDKKASRVVFQQVYTYNDFYFDDDPVYGKNKLPGVPVHLYQAAINFEHESGFYIGFNTETSPSSYYADYADSVSAKEYAIFGSKLGWRQPGDKGWEVFLDFKNLLDERYAAVVTPTSNANGVDTSLFYPGVGRSITGGVSYSF